MDAGVVAVGDVKSSPAMIAEPQSAEPEADDFGWICLGHHLAKSFRAQCSHCHFAIFSYLFPCGRRRRGDNAPAPRGSAAVLACG
ncbi:hypothetical protein [uncultured Bosea sp.]|uniref:hypothetical protein n=1 Tax=uncultured Bosea sp. TaxID=211457 RepID=UPI00263AEE7A|nr:hypothetical protein [uncultured Bosea sp.]